MRTYSIAIANDYTSINSPLIINAGYHNTKLSGYKCITKLARGDYKIIPYTSGIKQVDDITLMVRDENSYTAFLRDESQSDNTPVPFSFYAWQDVYSLNTDTLNFILSQELPALYKDTNDLNAADNAGIVAVILEVYGVLYELFYNSITSLGIVLSPTIKPYNENWEYVYVGINKILQNAAFPAQFLKTLMRVKTQTSTQIFSLSITISRLLYQLRGVPIPVEIVYDPIFEGWNINIYDEVSNVWALEVEDFSELEVSTFLLGSATEFIWLITLVIIRIMPAFLKWRIQYFSIVDFRTNFNATEVGDEDFYDPTVRYDAYMVVNNNNNFNTKGYIRE